jgi:ABC-2 type transport system ATP-binding protein
MLCVTGLHKTFGRIRALDEFDLMIAPGEVVGLIGPNGAGKSTFDRIVAGIERPDRGQVIVAGVDLAIDPYGARARLGLAGQELALYPGATVTENLRLFGAVAGLGGGTLRRAIERTCLDLQLVQLTRRRVGTLSAGQQRRVHAAAAMLHRPAVLLLDEPTVGADPLGREALLQAVRACACDGSAVCYTTHYLPELEVLGATVAVAVAGRIVARGTLAQVTAEAGATDLDGVFRHWAPAAPGPARALMHDAG